MTDSPSSQTSQLDPGRGLHEVVSSRGVAAQMPFDSLGEDKTRYVQVATGMNDQGQYTAMVVLDPFPLQVTSGDLETFDEALTLSLIGQSEIEAAAKALAFAAARLKAYAKDIKAEVVVGGVRLNIRRG